MFGGSRDYISESEILGLLIFIDIYYMTELFGYYWIAGLFYLIIWFVIMMIRI